MAETYTTKQGDTWDIIARELWGERGEVLFHHLMAANPDHLEAVVFSGGIELTVPDIDLPQNLIKPFWQEP